MRVGFIGTGNMGGAIAQSVAKQDVDVVLSNFMKAEAENLSQKIGKGVHATNAEIAATCQVIFLGVKPYQLLNLLESLEAEITKNPEALWVSMSAGLTLEDISQYLPNTAGLIRMMPNTPVSIGQGMTTFSVKPSDRATHDQETFTYLMAKSGKLLSLPEHLIDAATGISGCGPAFVYQFIEALADAGVQNGLQRADAIQLAAQTVLGAAQLVLESGQHPAVLKDQVTSPGGSTVAGVVALEEKGFRHASISAVNVAIKRTKELGK